jgi:hypothetical protein
MRILQTGRSGVLFGILNYIRLLSWSVMQNACTTPVGHHSAPILGHSGRRGAAPAARTPAGSLGRGHRGSHCSTGRGGAISSRPARRYERTQPFGRGSPIPLTSYAPTQIQRKRLRIRLRSAFRYILTKPQMPQIVIDIADDPILVINNGPIPLRRRQLHPKRSHRHPSRPDATAP